MVFLLDLARLLGKPFAVNVQFCDDLSLMKSKQQKGKLENLLRNLNTVQRAVVEAPLGPVLVLAGAGSGKTRVLTHRIAYLLTKKAFHPHEILAVTFTNKAAQEMKLRIQSLLGRNFKNLWVGTFHSVFARILRFEAQYLGYKRNFAIYDVDDQKRALKKIMEDLHISLQDHSVNDVQRKISNLKNKMISPDQFRREIRSGEDEVVEKIYRHYTGFLRANNAMDFDDLINLPVQLFESFPKVLQKYQEKFRYILVDEYQDTNLAQNQLVMALGRKSRNVFVVGDDDQSIYRWRGAEVRNILEFEQQFPDCRVFRLEQNYRSTRNILEAAYAVVKNNVQRKAKRLWTERDDGEKITVLESGDEMAEGRYIADTIRREISKNKRNFKDFVILYRTNAQSRAIEDALRRSTIAYTIVGGQKFYERKEIKDFLAYLRVIANPIDSVSLARIINFPPRSIGAVTLQRLQAFASENKLSLLEALGRAPEVAGLSRPMKNRVVEVYRLFQKYIELKATLSLKELASVLTDEIGLREFYRTKGTEEALNRYDNIVELMSAITEFSNTREKATLEMFLEEVSLVSDIDTWDDASNSVTLMTIHSAKGLEFPVVFIAGLEEGLFPLRRAKEIDEELEEERRLFYVALTRAKEKVYLSWARSRRQYLQSGQSQHVSQFVKQIPAEFLELPGHSRSAYGGRNASSAGRTPAYPRKKRESHAQEMPQYEDFSQEPQPIFVGAHVKHPKFGLGIILGIEGRGPEAKLTIFFDGIQEQKKLVFKYANLEILS